MALPPCHMFCQFFVTLTDSKPKLSCLMYQRSCDLGLGVPFNIASYALLTCMIAHITDTEPHEFILQMGDAHVYADHVEPLRTQLTREPRQFPTLQFKRTAEEIGSIDGFRADDFEVIGYKPMGKIDMKMSVSRAPRIGLIIRHEHEHQAMTISSHPIILGDETSFKVSVNYDSYPATSGLDHAIYHMHHIIYIQIRIPQPLASP
jgi:hypothetical protein